MRQRFTVQKPAEDLGEASGGSSSNASAKESTVANSAEGVLGVGLRRCRGSSEDARSAEERIEDEGESLGDSESEETFENSSTEGEDGDEIRNRNRLRKVDILNALRVCKGDVKAAAEVLDISLDVLRKRMAKDPRILAVYSKGSTIEAPTTVDVMARTPLPEVVGKAEGEAMIAMNSVLTNGALEKVIKPETIALLNQAPSVFGNDAGKYLTATLDLHHQMMVISNVQVFERAQEILKGLRDGTYGIEEAPEWQKTYNQLVELLQKGYDRAWQGTLSAAKLLKQSKDSDPERKAKPGFSPLKR